MVGYRKKIIAKNLQKSFPNKTNQEYKRITKDFYTHLSDLLVEHIKALTITPERLLTQIQIKNIELLEHFYQQKQSVLLISGHIGNWEWIVHSLALRSPYIICAGYQPLQSKNTDKIVRALRTRFGRKVIPYGELYKYMLTYQGAPQIVGLLIDQAPFNKQTSHWVTFLHQNTAVSMTVPKIAQKCNYPIIYGEVSKIERGKYELTFSLIAAEPTKLTYSEIAALYMNKLEENIRASPALWLWSHRRWK